MSASALLTRWVAAMRAAFCLSRSPFMASTSALSLSTLSLLSDSEASSSSSCCWLPVVLRSIQDGTPVPTGATESGADDAPDADWPNAADVAAPNSASAAAIVQWTRSRHEPRDLAESAAREL